MLLDELMYTQVKHVKFDCNITAGGVNLKSSFVVDEDDLGGKHIADVTNSCLF